MDNDSETNSGLSRRRMLKGTAAAGAVAWATPAVARVMSAHAVAPGSNPPPPPPPPQVAGSTYSEVLALLTCGQTVYRVKYDPQSDQPGSITPGECGGSPNMGVGKNLGSHPCSDGFHRNQAGLAAGCPSTSQLSATLGVDGSVTLHGLGGCTITAYAWHNGQCCYQLDGTNLTTLTLAGNPPNKNCP